MKLALQFDSTHALKTHLLPCVFIGPKKFLAYLKVQDKRYRSLNTDEDMVWMPVLAIS